MSRYIGDVSAYALAVSQGYTGTEEEYAELMASYATVAQTAVNAKDAAVAANTAAQSAKTAAAGSASTAQTAATTATSKANEATTAAGTATTKAAEASQSASTASTAASTASTKASEATTAAGTATTAKNDAVAAKTAAETAQGKAEDAQAAAENAAESVSASAAQIATNTADISDLKENLSGLESDGVAPSAEQLLSKNTTADAVPYHFRQTGGDGADREYVDAIVGGTVCWNQLIYIAQNDSSKTQNGVTITDNRDGTYTVKTDADGAEAITYLALSNANVTMINGHKYLLFGTPTTGDINTYYSYIAGAVTVYDYGKGIVFSAAAAGTATPVVAYVKQGTIIATPITFKPQLFDLTAMFGSTIADYIYSLEQSTAGAGVALFKSLFPNDYYPYNAGELVSVSGLTAHKTVEFNQWDEEWEVGSIDASGNNDPDLSRIKSKNYTAVFPNTNYYFNAPYTLGIRWYAEDKSFISGTSISASSTNKVMESPSNACYLRFSVVGTTTYNHDICINLSDPAKNGTYEPYKAHSYPLDSTLTLRGIPKLDSNNKLYFDGDTYDADGTVTRKRRRIVVDGNTYKAISVRLNNGVYYTVLNAFTSDTRAVGSDTITKRIITNAGYNDYPAVGIGNTYIIGDGLTCVICLFDQTLTDATSVNNYLASHPIVMEYELAKPVIEDATPYQHLQQCDPNGTEEFVSTGIVPVGHETRYPENLRAKIDGLPWDFSSLIAPTEKTTTASRNYTAGSLLIMGNVLYKVTANIANGGTITPNTNVTATTLSEILSALAQ